MHLVYGNRIVSERLLSDVSRNSLLYVFTRTYLNIIFFAIYYHSENETYGNSEIFLCCRRFVGYCHNTPALKIDLTVSPLN